MNTEQPRILIVDDEPNICQSCVKILSKQGHHVQHALNGYDALKMMADEPFCVIVTDLEKSEARIAKTNLVAAAHLGTVDTLTVDERAVGRTQIDERKRVALIEQAGVFARYGMV